MTKTLLKDRVMTYDQFEKLKKHIEKVISFDESNLTSKLSEFSRIYSNLSNICVDEELYISELKSEQASLLSDIQDSIKTGRILYENKDEIKIKMNGDIRIKEINLEISKREIMVRYIQIQQQNLTNLRYDVTNFIKWKEYEAG